MANANVSQQSEALDEASSEVVEAAARKSESRSSMKRITAAGFAVKPEEKQTSGGEEKVESKEETKAPAKTGAKKLTRKKKTAKVVEPERAAVGSPTQAPTRSPQVKPLVRTSDEIDSTPRSSDDPKAVASPTGDESAAVDSPAGTSATDVSGTNVPVPITPPTPPKEEVDGLGDNGQARPSYVAKKKLHLSYEEEQKQIQAKATLKDGLSQILAALDSFDTKAAAAFGVFKRGLQLSSELPEDLHSTLVGEVDEKRKVLEFLCQLAKLKRMYCKQVQLVLDSLLKCPVWADLWRQSEDLRARLPANLRSNYEGEEEQTAERLAREAQEELEALVAESGEELGSAEELLGARQPSVETLDTLTAMVEQLEGPPSSSQEAYQEPPTLVNTASVKSSTSTCKESPAKVSSFTAHLKLEAGADATSSSVLPDAPEHRVDSLSGTGSAALILPGITSRSLGPDSSPREETALAAPRIRKRDKVRAFFRRAFMCVEA